MEQGRSSGVEVINLWTGPRFLSTSLMYSFVQRDDIEVLDEPLYPHYLRVTGVDHPYREELLESDEEEIPIRQANGEIPDSLLFDKRCFAEGQACGSHKGSS